MTDDNIVLVILCWKKRDLLFCFQEGSHIRVAIDMMNAHHTAPRACVETYERVVMFTTKIKGEAAISKDIIKKLAVTNDA